MIHSIWVGMPRLGAMLLCIGVALTGTTAMAQDGQSWNSDYGAGGQNTIQSPGGYQTAK